MARCVHYSHAVWFYLEALCSDPAKKQTQPGRKERTQHQDLGFLNANPHKKETLVGEGLTAGSSRTDTR